MRFKKSLVHLRRRSKTAYRHPHYTSAPGVGQNARYVAITPNTSFLNRLLECLKTLLIAAEHNNLASKLNVTMDGHVNEGEKMLWIAVKLPLCSSMWLSLQLLAQRKKGPCRCEVKSLMPYLLQRCCTNPRHQKLDHLQ